MVSTFSSRKDINSYNVTGGLITPDFFVLSRLLGYDFLSAAAVLEGLLERHESRLPKTAPRREAK